MIQIRNKNKWKIGKIQLKSMNKHKKYQKWKNSSTSQHNNSNKINNNNKNNKTKAIATAIKNEQNVVILKN